MDNTNEEQKQNQEIIVTINETIYKYTDCQANLLGKGTFGSVYKGTQQIKNKINSCAIKIVYYPEEETEINQIKEEAKLWQEINQYKCKHILELYDIFDDEQNKKMYFISELCQNSLFQELASSELEILEYDALEIVEQIATGLKVLHDHNFMHRDIKPENILYNIEYVSTEQKKIIYKISDFTLLIKQDTATDIVGTPSYMPPEQFGNEDFYTNKVDIWALGILFDEILFKQLFYFDDNLSDLINQIFTVDYYIKPNRNIDNDIQQLLTNMIQKKTVERYSIEQTLKNIEKIKIKLNPVLDRNNTDQKTQALPESLKEKEQKLYKSEIITKSTEKQQNLEEIYELDLAINELGQYQQYQNEVEVLANEEVPENESPLLKSRNHLDLLRKSNQYSSQFMIKSQGYITQKTKPQLKKKNDFKNIKELDNIRKKKYISQTQICQNSSIFNGQLDVSIVISSETQQLLKENKK